MLGRHSAEPYFKSFFFLKKWRWNRSIKNKSEKMSGNTQMEWLKQERKEKKAWNGKRSQKSLKGLRRNPEPSRQKSESSCLESCPGGGARTRHSVGTVWDWAGWGSAGCVATREQSGGTTDQTALQLLSWRWDPEIKRDRRFTLLWLTTFGELAKREAAYDFVESSFVNV